MAFSIIAGEVYGEKKYGINTTGADDLKALKKKGIDISHATVYMPVSYRLLEKIFDHIPTECRNHFIDIGCGKGRALCVAAHQGFKQITGVDFSEELCKSATENLAITNKAIHGINYTVINENAQHFKIPSNADCIFLFNPFDATIIKKVIENINASLSETHRNLYVCYVNPVCKDLFIELGFTEIWYYRRHKYFEVSLLLNNLKNNRV